VTCYVRQPAPWHRALSVTPHPARAWLPRSGLRNRLALTGKHPREDRRTSLAGDNVEDTARVLGTVRPLVVGRGNRRWDDVPPR